MRWLLVAVMVFGLGLSACGKKGDLVPPGGEDDPDQARLTTDAQQGSA